MLGKSPPVVILRAVMATLFLAFTLSLAAQDHDVPVSVDGIRCDSCGTECSMHCGSRTFRACCYNYIKKRSIPWQGPSGGGSGDSEDGNQQTPSKSSSGAISDIKSPVVAAPGSSQVKAPLLVTHQTGGTGSKHIFQRFVPDTLSATESMEDGELMLYPLTLRDLMASMVRTLNAYENKKLARTLAF